MEFEITATITITREVTGTINVRKQDVVDAGFCKSVEDGDSTAWYGYVADFLESEFEANEYDYYPSDIEIIDDFNEAMIEEVSDISIDW
tara:strand:+ start:972 stop:1238 length:267 start_codon:yes stop_codon:yes gene_type:complete